MTNSTLNAEYKTFRGQAIKEIGTDDKDALILTLNKSIKYMKLFRVCLIFVGMMTLFPILLLMPFTIPLLVLPFGISYGVYWTTKKVRLFNSFISMVRADTTLN